MPAESPIRSAPSGLSSPLVICSIVSSRLSVTSGWNAKVSADPIPLTIKHGITIARLIAMIFSPGTVSPSRLVASAPERWIQYPTATYATPTNVAALRINQKRLLVRPPSPMPPTSAGPDWDAEMTKNDITHNVSASPQRSIGEFGFIGVNEAISLRNGLTNGNRNCLLYTSDAAD